MSKVAGSYRAFYAPRPVFDPTKTTQSPGTRPIYIGGTTAGFEQIETFHSERVNMDDFGGVQGAVVDLNELGLSCSVELDYAEYDRIAQLQTLGTDKYQAADAVYASQGGTGAGATAGATAQRFANSTVGIFASQLAGILYLVKVAGPNASPKMRKFPIAIVQSEIRTLLAAGLRHGPVGFAILPDTTGNISFTPGSSGAGTITYTNANYGLLYVDTL